MSANSPPAGWDQLAHECWIQGNNQKAIELTLQAINRYGSPKPLPLIKQLSYYIFLSGDPRAAAAFLNEGKKHYPDDVELLKNLSVCLSRSQQINEAIQVAQDLLKVTPNDPLVLDTLASCCSKTGDYEKASEYGSRSLQIKHEQSLKKEISWKPPSSRPSDWLSSQRSGRQSKNVIAFSLWGQQPTYLRGALDNMLAAHIYEGWTLRFYVDDSVPEDLIEALKSLGAEVFVEPADQSKRNKLTWRFKVANDPTVCRFLIRDVDSVLSLREKEAVDAWMASDKWFHVMRDWWTHTDLILAGMWGGMAGVLPDLADLLKKYKSPAMETDNIDQWFLRDEVWPLIYAHTLVHDRCFTHLDHKPWPGKTPEGNVHVGQDEFAARRVEQEKRLGKWMEKIQSLR